MTEILLVIIFLSQSGLIWYVIHSQKEERAKLINAVVSKDTQEMVTLEALDKRKPEKQIKTEDAMTPIDQLSDEDFKKFVLNEK